VFVHTIGLFGSLQGLFCMSQGLFWVSTRSLLFPAEVHTGICARYRRM